MRMESTPIKPTEQAVALAHNLFAFVTNDGADLGYPTADAGYPYDTAAGAVEFELIGADEKRYVISVRQEDAS